MMQVAGKLELLGLPWGRDEPEMLDSSCAGSKAKEREWSYCFWERPQNIKVKWAVWQDRKYVSHQ